MAAKKKQQVPGSSVDVRRNVMSALYHVNHAKADLDYALAIVESSATADLASAVKALRAIANASNGTPARNLMGIASATLRALRLEAQDGRTR